MPIHKVLCSLDGMYLDLGGKVWYRRMMVDICTDLFLFFLLQLLCLIECIWPQVGTDANTAECVQLRRTMMCVCLSWTRPGSFVHMT